MKAAESAAARINAGSNGFSGGGGDQGAQGGENGGANEGGDAIGGSAGGEDGMDEGDDQDGKEGAGSSKEMAEEALAELEKRNQLGKHQMLQLQISPKDLKKAERKGSKMFPINCMRNDANAMKGHFPETVIHPAVAAGQAPKYFSGMAQCPRTHGKFHQFFRAKRHCNVLTAHMGAQSCAPVGRMEWQLRREPMADAACMENEEIKNEPCGTVGCLLNAREVLASRKGWEEKIKRVIKMAMKDPGKHSHLSKKGKGYCIEQDEDLPLFAGIGTLSSAAASKDGSEDEIASEAATILCEFPDWAMLNPLTKNVPPKAGQHALVAKAGLHGPKKTQEAQCAEEA